METEDFTPPAWLINTIAEGVLNCTAGTGTLPGWQDGEPCEDCKRAAKLPGVAERLLTWRTIELNDLGGAA